MTGSILRPARWKIFTSLAIASLAFSVIVLAEFGFIGRMKLKGELGLGLLGLMCVGYAYSNCGRYIRLLPEALEVGARFSDVDRILWSDIDDIGIAHFPSTARGRLTYQYFVGIKLRTEPSYLLQKGHQKNYAECGYHILLDSNYGLGLERFAAVLNDRRKAA